MLGYRASFYSAAVFMGIGTIVAWVFVHEDFTPSPAGTQQRGVWSEARSLLGIALVPVLAMVVFMIQVGGNIVAPVLSLFIAELSGSENAATAAGLVLAATGAVSAVSAVAIGRVSDRVGPRRILPVCLAGAAIAYLPQAFVQQLWQLLLLRMLLGVFLGGLMPSANALMAGMVSRERRGAAFGLTSAASAMANAAGPLSAAAIVSFWGLRDVFLATAVLFVLAYGWVTIGFRRHPVARPHPEPEEALPVP